MSEEIKKGSDKYLMFAEDLQESIYKFGFDYVVDLILDLQQKVEQLENIINEAKEECKSVIEDSEHTTVSEFNINGLMRTILNILNKGSE